MMWVTPSTTPLAWLVRRGLSRNSASDMLARNPKYCPEIVLKVKLLLFLKLASDLRVKFEESHENVDPMCPCVSKYWVAPTFLDQQYFFRARKKQYVKQAIITLLPLQIYKIFIPQVMFFDVRVVVHKMINIIWIFPNIFFLFIIFFVLIKPCTKHIIHFLIWTIFYVFINPVFWSNWFS